MDLSIVIPVHNEHESVPGLAREVDAALVESARAWECIWVDDGSDDATLAVLGDLHARDPIHYQFVSLKRRAGQSAALAVGIRASSGRMIATLDGDLQNDPAELPRIVAMLERGNADMVTGVRRGRKDEWVRRVSSRVANGFRNRITGDRIRDVGCSLRAFTRESVADVPVFNGMHRFLPTLVRMHGFRVIEVPVAHRPRRFGRTKYGVRNRLWRGVADCFAVRWMRSRAVHPEIGATSLTEPHRERMGSL